MTLPVPIPGGACDTHIHFYDAAYTTASQAVLRPRDATVADYRELQESLGLERVVVVQPTTYGFDNSCQLVAMQSLGVAARGVMVVGENTGQTELGRLTDLGVRGARFHMLAGGALGWDVLDRTAELIAPFGWHIQLQMNGLELADRLDQLKRLPVDIVVDHVGRFMPPRGIEHRGFKALMTLIDDGRTWVKLSAAYESSPDVCAVVPLIDELVQKHPDRLLWATNWPHPGQTAPPTHLELAESCYRWLPSKDVRDQVLVRNPAYLYDF